MRQVQGGRPVDPSFVRPLTTCVQCRLRDGLPVGALRPPDRAGPGRLLRGRRRCRGRCGWPAPVPRHRPVAGCRCWRSPSGCGCCPAAARRLGLPDRLPSGAPACGPRGSARTRTGTCGCSPAASWTPGCGTSTATCSGSSRRPADGSPSPAPVPRAAARWRCTRAWRTTPGPSPTGRWPRSRARRRSSRLGGVRLLRDYGHCQHAGGGVRRPSAEARGWPSGRPPVAPGGPGD